MKLSIRKQIKQLWKIIRSKRIQFFIFIGILSLFITWFLKDPATLLLFGKIFSQRSLEIQILLLAVFFATVFSAVSIAGLILESYFPKQAKWLKVQESKISTFFIKHKSRILVISLVTIVIIFIFQYFFIRIPFYQRHLISEEGGFAELLVYQPEGPDYMLRARIDGEVIYGPPRHSAMLYEAIRIYGKIISIFIDFKNMPAEQLNTMIRFSFSIFQFLSFSLMIAAVFLMDLHEKKYIYLILIILISISPISLYTSDRPQTDTSVGALFLSLFGFSIAFFSEKKSGKPNKDVFLYGLLLIASVILGLGKGEWAISLLLSILGAVILSAILKVKNWHFAALAILIGVTFGMAISYFYDETNYLFGLQRLFRFIQRDQSALAGETTSYFEQMLDKNSRRLPFISSLLVVIILNIYAIIQNWKKLSFTQILLFLYVFALFTPYVLTTWSVSARYFVVSMVISFYSLILLNPKNSFGWMKIATLVSMALFSYFVHPEIKPFRQLDLKAKEGCVYVTSMSAGFFNRDAGFINGSLGTENVNKIIEEYNTERCK